MLLKGDFPKAEPIISIGLVLPQDKQSSISITDSKTKKIFQLKTKANSIFINQKYLKKQLHFKNNSKNQSYILNQVTAGRNFHWEKKITINVFGDLIIKNKQGFLFIINQIKLEEYLICVATSEMSSSCPITLLEAQTIAARSWILAAYEQKHTNLKIDACNDDCCQRYQGINNLNQMAYKASSNTKGIILTYQNKICDTRYSKSCGGISENNENVWFDSPKLYLRSIYDSTLNKIPNLKNEKKMKDWIYKPKSCFCDNSNITKNQLKNYLGDVDENGSYFRWEYSINHNELCELIKIKTGIIFEKIKSLDPIDRGISGRIIKLKINGYISGKITNIILKSEYEIRRVLHPKFLYSSAFIIIANLNSTSSLTRFILKGAGWGHGVGLCQIGALNMALKDYSSKEILFHYFQNTKLKKLYD